MTDTDNMEQTIGGIARAAGVNVETVRYYERIGLLPRPPRAQGTFRRYPAEALQRIRFIKRAQWLGFSLEDVAVLLALAEERQCRSTRALGEMKLSLLRRKLEELASAQGMLEALLCECAEGRGPGCPLIEALLKEEDNPSPEIAPSASARTGNSVQIGATRRSISDARKTRMSNTHSKPIAMMYASRTSRK